MSQERKNTLGARERFEDGVLRTDACMERHYTGRDFQYRTAFEDLGQRAFGVSALRQEDRLMRQVYCLMSLGLRPSGSETLEDFVSRHSEVLPEPLSGEGR